MNRPNTDCVKKRPRAWKLNQFTTTKPKALVTETIFDIGSLMLGR
jgi:hypothetical protein